jgi:uncharacterized metal-binding protein (TIGR02443 family)
MIVNRRSFGKNLKPWKNKAFEKEKVVRKRFIAGASCPSCSTQDTLRWWLENNIEWVECVECEFKEQRKPQSLEKSPQGNAEMIGVFKPD